MGDFNDVSCVEFMEFMLGKSLVQHVSCATSNHGSQLDLLFTNVESDSISSGSIYMGWTDHSTVWAHLFA